MVACLLLVVAIVAGAGSIAAAGGRRRVRPRAPWLAHVGLSRPVVLGVGARMALDSGRDRRGSSAPAIVGAIAAVAGVVAIITLNHGLTDALRNPEVAGVAWDATAVPNTESVTLEGVDPAVVDAVLAHPGLAATATVGRVVSQVGEIGVPTFTVFARGSGASLQLVTLRGRGPTSDDDVVLGPSTAAISASTSAAPSSSPMAPPPSSASGSSPTTCTRSSTKARGSRTHGGRSSSIPPSKARAAASTSIAVRFADRRGIDEQITGLREALGPTVQYVAPAELPRSSATSATCNVCRTSCRSSSPRSA